MSNKRQYLLHLLKAYKQRLTVPGPEAPHDVQCAAVYLQEHLFHAACTAGKMREKCSIPQNNFSTRFKHYLGQPPASYITHHRIEAAKKLLSEERLEDVPVGDIGYSVGYERAAAFSTTFTRKEGISPGIWREQRLEMRRIKRTK